MILWLTWLKICAKDEDGVGREAFHKGIIACSSTEANYWKSWGTEMIVHCCTEADLEEAGRKHGCVFWQFLVLVGTKAFVFDTTPADTTSCSTPLLMQITQICSPRF